VSYETNKRWRLKYPKKRNLQKKRYYKKSTVGAKNSRTQWIAKEMDSIIAFDRPHDMVLAKELKRSVQAIQIKRSRIKARE